MTSALSSALRLHVLGDPAPGGLAHLAVVVDRPVQDRVLERKVGILLRLVVDHQDLHTGVGDHDQARRVLLQTGRPEHHVVEVQVRHVLEDVEHLVVAVGSGRRGLEELVLDALRIERFAKTDLELAEQVGDVVLVRHEPDAQRLVLGHRGRRGGGHDRRGNEQSTQELFHDVVSPFHVSGSPNSHRLRRPGPLSRCRCRGGATAGAQSSRRLSHRMSSHVRFPVHSHVRRERLARLRLGPTKHARRPVPARACRTPPAPCSLVPPHRRPLSETWLNLHGSTRLETSSRARSCVAATAAPRRR